MVKRTKFSFPLKPKTHLSYPRVRGEGKRWRKVRPDARRDALARDARRFVCVCAVLVSVAYLVGVL